MTAISILKELIETRRSVKPEFYNKDPVDDQIIVHMLQSARWAPTHARTEPWRFTVCSGAGLQVFAKFQADLYRNATDPEKFIAAKYEKLLHTPVKASHLILVGLHRQESEKIPLNEEICAVACAVQNMLLTAHAHGVGAYWSTGGMTYHPAMREFMRLGEKDLCLGMVYVGNFSTEIPAGIRSELDGKVHWVTGV